MIEHRPCGACRSLVPADTGCGHWDPTNVTGKRVGWRKGRTRAEQRAENKAAMERLRASVLPGSQLI